MEDSNSKNVKTYFEIVICFLKKKEEEEEEEAMAMAMAMARMTKEMGKCCNMK
jgi:hypothetical protein